MTADALGYYNILQVTEDADAEQIKLSYRELAKKWHPDYNQDNRATDVFQEISAAYEVLSNPQKRLEYDILSLVYDKKNYPDLTAMQLIKSTGKEIDVRAVEIHENMAWGMSYKKTAKIVVSDYDTALKLHAKTAAVNWIFGWWHPQTFITNIKSLIKNFKTPVSSKESLKVLLHNMIFYAKEGQNEKAVKCGILAKNLLGRNNKSLERFLSALPYQAPAPQKWNLSLLRLCQLIVPFFIGIIAAIVLLKNSMDLNNWNFFSKKKEIDYYQKVDFGTRGQSVDDVVVGKILSIPIDKSDSSKLYHLTEEAKVMYGPSDDFDVIKILKEGTTVRLTGMTPDNIWSRIMIDNGEIGFVRLNILKQGTGKEIPFGSAIVE